MANTAQIAKLIHQGKTIYPISLAKAIIHLARNKDLEVLVDDIFTELGKKTNTQVGKGLSTNDLTNELKLKIESALQASDIAAKADRDSVYTKVETNAAIITAIAATDHLVKKIVPALPTIAEAKNNIIYMVLKSGGGSSGDAYDEYLLLSGNFEHIGSTDVDLADYVKRTDMTTALAGKVSTVAGKALSTNDFSNEYKLKVDTLTASAIEAQIVGSATYPEVDLRS